MKNIFNKILGVCLAVVAGAMFAGCSSDEEAVSQSAPQTGKFTLTVRAEKQGGTRALAVTDVDGDGIDDIQATWTAGDEVQVYDATTGEALTGVLTAQGSGASTLLTGTVEGTVSVGDALRLTFLSDDYSSQDGTLQYIAQHCDYAEATVTVGKVEAGVITPTGTASFANAQAIVKFTLMDENGAYALSADELVVGYGTGEQTLNLSSTTYTINGGTGVVYAALPGITGQTVALTATIGEDTYVKEQADVTFEAGRYYPVGVNMKMKIVGVDLGLPSGTLWANMNIGAKTPEDYGDYIAWGETTGYKNGKTNFTWNTYKWWAGTSLTKYCTNSNYGTVDNRTELLSDDDAAFSQWGTAWRMPSSTQMNELITYCTWKWTTRNGVNGYLVTGTNGKTIFLPAVGFREGTSLNYAGTAGDYWTRSLYTSTPGAGYRLYFTSSSKTVSTIGRYQGFAIRPIRTAAEEPENAQVVNLGLSVKWANMNIGAENPEDYGDYFAWGETEGYNSGKTAFTWETYKWCNGTANSLTKYNTNSSNGTTDSRTTLLSSDDAAFANWGGSWRMPTKAEFDELLNYTTKVWTQVNGINGWLLTSTKSGYTDKSIFLPAGGFRNESEISEENVSLNYWSSTLYQTLSLTTSAYNLLHYSGYEETGYGNMGGHARVTGMTVRAVCP